MISVFWRTGNTLITCKKLRLYDFDIYVRVHHWSRSWYSLCNWLALSYYLDHNWQFVNNKAGLYMMLCCSSRETYVSQDELGYLNLRTYYYVFSTDDLVLQTLAEIPYRKYLRTIPSLKVFVESVTDDWVNVFTPEMKGCIMNKCFSKAVTQFAHV